MQGLPRELFEEILSYTSVRDIQSYYEAIDRKPSQQELNLIARKHLLPTGTSFDVLMVYEEEMNIEERINHCIYNNDIVAFTYLLPHLNKPRELDISFLQGYEWKIWRRESVKT